MKDYLESFEKIKKIVQLSTSEKVELYRIQKHQKYVRLTIRLQPSRDPKAIVKIRIMEDGIDRLLYENVSRDLTIVNVYLRRDAYVYAFPCAVPYEIIVQGIAKPRSNEKPLIQEGESNDRTCQERTGSGTLQSSRPELCSG